MTNIEYYSLKNLEFKIYDLDDDYVVIKCLYKMKHSIQNLILASFVSENDEKKINERKIKWLLKEINPELYNDLVDNQSEYRHLKVKGKQFCFE